MPLQGLPSPISLDASRSAASSHLLPIYPPVAISPNTPLRDTPSVAPAASPDFAGPTIDLPVPHRLHDLPPVSALTPSVSTVGGILNESGTQMHWRSRVFAAVAGTSLLSLSVFSQVYQKVLFPRITPISERAEDAVWIASSQSWLDRTVCRSEERRVGKECPV